MHSRFIIIALLALLALVLLISALTARLWLPPLLQFLTQNSTDVQNLTNLAQLLLFAGTVIAAIASAVRWFRPRQLVPQTQPFAPSPTPAQAPAPIININIPIAEIEAYARRAAQNWGATANLPPPRLPAREALAELRRLMTDKLSADDVRAVAFDLGLDYNDLAGAAKAEKVMTLLDTLQKHSRLSELIKPLNHANTSVDWAHALADTLSDAPRPSDEVRTKYFEVLAATHKFMNFKGMALDGRTPLNVPLLDVYVPLFVRRKAAEGERDVYGRKLRVAGRTLSTAEGEGGGKGDLNEAERNALGGSFTERAPVLEVLNQSKGLILLGDPGSGKSTLLKFLAVALATNQGDKLGLGIRFPILLPLRDYAAEIETRKISLHEFLIEYHTREMAGLNGMGELLRYALATGKALILLDGLDEVKEAHHRQNVLAETAGFFNLHKLAGNVFVLTSRIIGYDQVRLAIPDMVECILEDFDDDDVRRFIENWTLVLEKLDQGGDTGVARLRAAEERASLTRAIFAKPKVRELASNPLILTIMANMKRFGIRLPELRVELYDKCVEVFLKTWDEGRSLSGAHLNPINLQATREVLAALALWSQRTSPGANRIEARAARQELRRIYTEQGHLTPDQAVDGFFAAVRDSANLLVERGVGEYGFIHRTFLEYLAAVGIAQHGQLNPDLVVQALAEHLDEQDWREVMVLTVPQIGIVRDNTRFASEVIRRLLACGRGAPGMAAIVAGESVLNALPAGVTQACVNDVLQALQAVLQDPAHVAAALRAEAGQVLGQLGDPRPETRSCNAMPLCLVPRGPFVLGSIKERDEDAYDDELHGKPHDMAYDYFIGQHPVTNAQFREFMEAGGYAHAGYWAEASRAKIWRAGAVYRNVYYLDDKKELKIRPESEQGKGATKPYDFGEPFNLPNHPVVGICWYEALAFVRWLSDEWKEVLPAGWQVRLPNEVEWEKAARGGLHIPRAPIIVSAQGDGLYLGDHLGGEAHPLVDNPNPTRRYAYNDVPGTHEPDANRMNYDQTGIRATSGMGCFANGASPYGCQDMNGNVWEWTRSLWGKENEPKFKYPYAAGDGRENLAAGDEERRVVRGGSWFDGRRVVRAAVRVYVVPSDGLSYQGLRVVVSAPV